MCQAISLAEPIDRIVGPTERQVSVGEAVHAMVLNALGFTARPLSLNPECFANKPLDRLLRPGLTAEMLNDDSLGRAPDILHEKGATEGLAQVAAHALRVSGIEHRFVYPDTTSFGVEGEYDRPEAPGIIRITDGYSRDHRPDLKPVIAALLTTYRLALPVWIQALDGTTNDRRAFPSLVEAYLAQVREKPMPYLVANRALYTEENTQRLSAVQWLTRVLERVGLVKQLIAAVSAEEMEPAFQEGYRYLEMCTTWGRDTPTLAGGLVGTGGTTGAGDPAEAGGKGAGERGEGLASARPLGMFLAGGSGRGRAGAGAEMALSPVGGKRPVGATL
jgi:transposase